MKTYTIDQLVNCNSEQTDQIQKTNDNMALEFIEEHNNELSYLNTEQKEHLREYFTDTMEKYRLIYEAIVAAFSTPIKPGFPEYIYNIDLKNGQIETDKNGRRINYSTEVLAPCTTAMLHYINNDCNDVYVVIPPIKSAERTVEKIVSECIRETEESNQLNIKRLMTPVTAAETFEDEPELPFMTEPPVRHCSTYKNLQRELNEQQGKTALLGIAQSDILPKDIYRLSITSKYPGDLEELIRELEQKFPSYIKFEKGERNLYKKNLSENTRNYFDIKKTACITIPNSSRKFYMEFQFKQTNMFFAHIRSHSAYEEYRVLDAKYIALRDAEKKRKTTSSADNKAKLALLKKQRDEKKDLCLAIHRNAVHQSNLYLLHKLLWLDDNAHGLHRQPEYKGDRYKYSIDLLKKNYIVESYTPFDGLTAFSTGPDEYLNKSFYLKLIKILPESFNELGKNAKEQINKAWSTLTKADIKDFNRITEMAIKYQRDILDIQKKRKTMDPNILLTVLADDGR